MSKAIPNLRIFLLLIFLSLSLILLDNSPLLSTPKQAIFYITNPISFGLYRSGQNINKQFYFIFQARFAAQENKALKEQIGKVLSENAQLRKKIAEVESILSQERHLDPETYNLIAARPIGLSRFLKIDRGSKDDIKVGQAVVVNDNLVGRIVEVSEKSSNIQLIQDPDSKIAAFSQNLEGKAKGVVIGQFGTELLMDKILHQEKINEGDLVYSEGTEGFLPRGLILGRVIEVLKREDEVFKQAKIKEVFDIRDLELVFVIRD